MRESIPPEYALAPRTNETLARPAIPSKWAGIQSPKILDAVRVALSDDKMFSHREVVDVIRAALDDGILTPGELNDLRIVAEISETLLARLKAMLLYLIEQTRNLYGTDG